MRTRFLLLSALVSLLACAPPKAPDAGVVARYTVEGDFDDVKEEVTNAIKDRGLIVDHVSHIATMLERTGKDLGTTKAIFGAGRGEAFSFCSAVVSRKTMEADPHNIAFCPYTIAVYSTADEPKKVHVAFRRPQRADGSEAARAALKEVDSLLDGIVRDALRIKDGAK